MSVAWKNVEELLDCMYVYLVNYNISSLLYVLCVYPLYFPFHPLVSTVGSTGAEAWGRL